MAEGYAADGFYLKEISKTLKEKSKEVSVYYEERHGKTISSIETFEIVIPRATIQLVHCWTDRQVKFVRLSIRNTGGDMIELQVANQARGTAIVWFGNLDLFSGEAIVMTIENNANSRANAKLTVRGVK